MPNRKSAAMQLLTVAVMVGGQIGFAARVSAEPYPNCPFTSHITYSLCSNNPGIPGVTPGFSMTPDVPGTWGPDGMYTPVQGPLR